MKSISVRRASAISRAITIPVEFKYARAIKMLVGAGFDQDKLINGALRMGFKPFLQKIATDFDRLAVECAAMQKTNANRSTQETA